MTRRISGEVSRAQCPGGDLPESTEQGGPKEAALVVVESEHWMEVVGGEHRMVVVVLQQAVPALVSVHSVKCVTFTRQPP